MSEKLIKAVISSYALTEGVDDTGCPNLNKLQVLAKDLGGMNFDFEEGVAYVEIKGPEAAAEFMQALDDDDTVEGYDVMHDGEAIEGDDILTLPEDTTFAFTAYLSQDCVTYDSDDVVTPITDGENALNESAKEAVAAVAKVIKGVTAIDLTPTGDGVALDDEQVKKVLAACKDMGKVKSEKDEHSIDVGNNTLRMYRDGDAWTMQFDETRCQGILVDELGVRLDEVAKKITVNHKGVKKIKMKCPSGFKYSAADKACVKIAGAELAVRRKASIKAVVARKAGGEALKHRAAIRTKKAMGFRKSLGLH